MRVFLSLTVVLLSLGCESGSRGYYPADASSDVGQDGVVYLLNADNPECQFDVPMRPGTHYVWPDRCKPGICASLQTHTGTAPWCPDSRPENCTYQGCADDTHCLNGQTCVR